MTNDTEVFCEVMDTAEKDGITAALLSGFPLNMNVWFDTTNMTDAIMLICVPASQYHMVDTNAFARFHDPEDNLLGMIDENSLIIDCPLATNKRFGEFDQLTRSDYLYCWFVESEEEIRIRGIKGVSSWRKYIVYHLGYHTQPDIQHILFAPGIGIIEYTYHHNGTPCDMHMRLTEFRKLDPSMEVRKHDCRCKW